MKPFVASPFNTSGGYAQPRRALFEHAANLLTPIGQDYVPMDGNPSIDELYAEYRRVSGRSLSNLEYYRLFSTLRTAIIWNITIRQSPPDLRAGFAFAIDFIERKLDANARVVGAQFEL